MVAPYARRWGSHTGQVDGRMAALLSLADKRVSAAGGLWTTFCALTVDM